MISDLRCRLSRELHDLVEQLTVHIPTQLGSEQSLQEDQATVELQNRIQARIQFLHSTLEALDTVDSSMLPVQGAGFGSTVDVQDLDSGAQHRYTLMAGDLINLDAGEISLLSPVGNALIGGRPGDEIEVGTPLGRRRLRILTVRTLEEQLGGSKPAYPELPMPGIH